MLFKPFRYALPVLMLVVLTLAGTAKADFADKAKSQVENVSDSVLNVLENEKLGWSDREQRFHRILKENFAVRSIGRYALGRYWRAAGEQERDNYLNAFEDWAVAHMTDLFSGYSGETVNINGVTPVRENDVLVTAHVERPGTEKPVRLDWRVIGRGDKIRVVDLMIEGISFSKQRRDEFENFLNNHRQNGKVDVSVLTKSLKERAETLRKTQGSKQKKI